MRTEHGPMRRLRRIGRPAQMPLRAVIERAARMRVDQVSALLLAGSAAGGNVPPHGDLDLVVFTCARSECSRRMLVREQGWLLEMFVIAERDYEALLQEARKTALPSLVRMCKDSRILAGGDKADAFVKLARQAWLAGPVPVTYVELDRRRMELTELLDDFRDGKREESLFVAGKLLERGAEFILRAQDRWIGVGKWAYRTLAETDPDAASRMARAAEAFFRRGEREPLIRFLEGELAPYGGLLREGWLEFGRLAGQDEA